MLRSSAESKALPCGACPLPERAALSTGPSAVSCASAALDAGAGEGAERISFICAFSSVTSVSNSAICCWSRSIVCADTETVSVDWFGACCCAPTGKMQLATTATIIAARTNSQMSFAFGNVSSLFACFIAPKLYNSSSFQAVTSHDGTSSRPYRQSQFGTTSRALMRWASEILEKARLQYESCLPNPADEFAAFWLEASMLMKPSPPVQRIVFMLTISDVYLSPSA